MPEDDVLPTGGIDVADTQIRVLLFATASMCRVRKLSKQLSAKVSKAATSTVWRASMDGIDVVLDSRLYQISSCLSGTCLAMMPLD